MHMTQRQSGSVKVPQTRAELETMVARRGELNGQLREAENRRLNLAAQLDATPSNMRAPVAERLATLDARITQIEREVTQMDAAISTAMTDPKVMQGEVNVRVEPMPPEPSVPPVPPPPEGFIHVPPFESGIIHLTPRDTVVGGALLLSLVFLAGWIAWRLALRRLRREGVGAVASGANASHIAQLQQSVDAIALEVERISENQRYVTKVVNDQLPVRAKNE